MTKITLFVPGDIAEILRDIAERRTVSVSTVCREAILEYLKRCGLLPERYILARPSHDCIVR